MEESIDWSKVDPDVADFVLGQAEKHLEAQLTSGVASDSRAITAASILTGLSGAVLAGTLGFFTDTLVLAQVLAGLTMGALLAVAAYLCFHAARPVDFYFPGTQPSRWYRCLDAPLGQSKGFEAQNYQEMIEANDEALQGAARSLSLGMRVALASPVAAAVVYAVTWYASSPA